MYEYDSTFYEYISDGSLSSARAVLPLLMHSLPIKSVVDFGCGLGAWLSVWKELGVADVVGVDGAYVDKKNLFIDAENFASQDLTKPIDLGRRFDLVQSLEVAEHLPPDSAATFVATLIRHGHLVLFSAAVSGQGGENHINEQPYDYWRDLFRKHGYVCCDLLRPQLRHKKNVQPFYRYNMLLFADASYFSPLPPVLEATRLDDKKAVPDLSPLHYQLRKFVLRSLSPQTLTRIAILKKWGTIASRRRK